MQSKKKLTHINSELAMIKKISYILFYTFNVMLLALVITSVMNVDRLAMQPQSPEEVIYKFEKSITFPITDDEQLIRLIHWSEDSLKEIIKNKNLTQEGPVYLFKLYKHIASYYKNCQFNEEKTRYWLNKAFGDELYQLIPEEFKNKEYFFELLFANLSHKNEVLFRRLRSFSKVKNVNISQIFNSKYSMSGLSELKTKLTLWGIVDIKPFIVAYNNYHKNYEQVKKGLHKPDARWGPEIQLQEFYLPMIKVLKKINDLDELKKFVLDFKSYVRNPFVFFELQYINSHVFRTELNRECEFLGEVLSVNKGEVHNEKN